MFERFATKRFVTKFGIVVHHHDPECCVTICDCCPQGHGHSESSNPQGIFVRAKSSEAVDPFLNEALDPFFPNET